MDEGSKSLQPGVYGSKEGVLCSLPWCKQRLFPRVVSERNFCKGHREVFHSFAHEIGAGILDTMNIKTSKEGL